MKKCIITALLSALILALLLCGCKTKTLHCDHCNKEVVVSENSNMEENWALYCAECNEELFGDDPVLGAK